MLSRAQLHDRTVQYTNRKVPKGPLGNAMATVPVSAHNCEVISALHDARVGGSSTPAYQDMTLI